MVAVPRVVVLGASGGIGRHVVDQAARRGWGVTAAVRRPEALALPPGARAARFDAFDERSVRDAVQGHDAVISALGSRTARVPDPVTSTAVRHVLAAAADGGPRRLVAVSSVGIGDPAEYPLVVRALVVGVLFRRLAPHQYADVSAMEDLVRASDVDWTLARPTTLVGGRGTGRYRASTDARSGVRTHVARADVATFLLDQVLDDRYVRAAVQVGRPRRAG